MPLQQFESLICAIDCPWSFMGFLSQMNEFYIQTLFKASKHKINLLLFT